MRGLFVRYQKLKTKKEQIKVYFDSTNEKFDTEGYKELYEKKEILDTCSSVGFKLEYNEFSDKYQFIDKKRSIDTL